MWLHFVLTSLLTAGGGPVVRDAEADAEAQAPLVVEAQFLDAVQACGVTPAFKPDLRLETTPQIIAYRSGPRAVLVSRWSELPAPVRGFMTTWAANAAPDETPQVFFQSTFQDIGTAHELGHWLQHQSGRSLTLSRWDAEVEANRIGIAFAERRDGHDLTARRLERFDWLMALPYAPPEGRDRVEYFNSDYAALSRDPVGYGWYQAALVRVAWEDHAEGDFCDLVHLNAPPASTASPGSPDQAAGAGSGRS